MRKILVALMALFAMAITGVYLTGFFIRPIKEVKCEIKELTYYYADWCGFCRRIKEEGTLEKLRDLGVNIEEINIDLGPIKHSFRGIPTFVIEERIYTGYRTFEQLKELLKCK